MIQLDLTKEDAVILTAGLDALTRMFGAQLANAGGLAINEVLVKISAIEAALGKLNSAAASAQAYTAANGTDRGEPTGAIISN